MGALAKPMKDKKGTKFHRKDQKPGEFAVKRSLEDLETFQHG
jgi:hypothetical protein